MGPDRGGIPLKDDDYHIFPIRLPTLPSFPQPVTHYMFIKPDAPKIPTESTPRSLFVLNVPFDSTPALLKHLFSTQLGLPAGRIEAVRFEDDPKHSSSNSEIDVLNHNDELANLTGSRVPKSTKKKERRAINPVDELTEEDIALPPVWDRKLHHSGCHAVLVFVDKASAQACLSAITKAAKNFEKSPITWLADDAPSEPALGPARYKIHTELLHPDEDLLIEKANKYMSAYNSREAALARARATAKNEPDEDGFVTVAKGGVGKEKAKLALEGQESRKRKGEGLTDFYRFQAREKKKLQMLELKQGFAKDAERVREMRRITRQDVPGTWWTFQMDE